MHNWVLKFFLKPACTRQRWHLTTVRTCAWLWPKARRSCFVAFFSLYVQGFCFGKLFCTLTFLKILYFLPSHCQLSFAIYVSSKYGDRHKAVRILLLYITSDETCLYCMSLWVGGFWVKDLWIRDRFIAAYRQSLLQPSTHGTILSHCQATLLYMVSDTIHYFREMKLFVFIHLFYIYMLLLCASEPWMC